MPVIPLVPSDSPSLIFSLLRLSAHHFALAARASQPLKSGTLCLYLSVPVPVLTPSVVTSRPTTASRPSTPLNPSPLAPQIRLSWPLCAFINYIYLLTYLLLPDTKRTRYYYRCSVVCLQCEAGRWHSKFPHEKFSPCDAACSQITLGIHVTVKFPLQLKLFPWS